MARAVVQRVRFASVEVEGTVVGSIGGGLAILLGIGQGDTEEAVDRLADKIAVLRIFEDEAGKMNHSASEVHAEMLVVSQFTLYGDVRKGRRPSFIAAASPHRGQELYERFADRLARAGFQVARGVFGAHMNVRLENDGPVTILLDTADL